MHLRYWFHTRMLEDQQGFQSYSQTVLILAECIYLFFASPGALELTLGFL